MVSLKLFEKRKEGDMNLNSQFFDPAKLMNSLSNFQVLAIPEVGPCYAIPYGWIAVCSNPHNGMMRLATGLWPEKWLPPAGVGFIEQYPAVIRNGNLMVRVLIEADRVEIPIELLGFLGCVNKSYVDTIYVLLPKKELDIMASIMELEKNSSAK